MNRQARAIELLLAEDSPSDRLITTEALRQANLLNSLNVVEDGVEVMAYLRRQGKYKEVNLPDLILLDLNMPRMDGRQALAEIKSDPVFKYIPVIVLTTSSADEDVLHAYGHHANSYITKPVNFPSLVNALQTLGSYWFEVVVLPPLAGRMPTQGLARPAKAPTRAAGKIHVLLIEDSPTDALLLKEMLSGSSHSIRVTDVQRLGHVAPLLAKEDFDIIITDLGLPDSQGIQTLKQLKLLAGRLPIVVLTGNEDEAQGIMAMREGAADYVFKSELHTRGLIRSVIYTVDRKEAEEKLIHSRRMEALGQLSAGIAHEFNNLLTIIQGHSNLLTSEQFPDDVKTSAFAIEKAADRAGNLTRQLLTFTRKQTLKASAVDINEIAGQTLRMLHRILGVQLRVQIHLNKLPLVVEADISMMEQVIVNLAINARDAMPDGGVLTLETSSVELAPDDTAMHPDAYPGKFAILKVSDTGMGIAKELADKIFEPFFTTKEVGEGTGLGLATVLGIVQQHRGWIVLESSEGKGATFSLYFPLVTPVSVAATIEPESYNMKPGAQQQILIVDDEESLRELVSTVLQQSGYRVLAAASAAQARQLWEAHKDEIRLVFTDIAMTGGISGLDFAYALRTENPGLPVIISSGYDSDFMKQRKEIERDFLFLAKPYSIQSLRELIGSTLEQHQGYQ